MLGVIQRNWKIENTSLCIDPQGSPKFLTSFAPFTVLNYRLLCQK